jgi:hypothetical protein
MPAVSWPACGRRRGAGSGVGAIVIGEVEAFVDAAAMDAGGGGAAGVVAAIPGCAGKPAAYKGATRAAGDAIGSAAGLASPPPVASGARASGAAAPHATEKTDKRRPAATTP